MACRESGVESKVLLCLGLYLVAGSFCHCTRLIKLKALDKPREKSDSTVSHGQPKGNQLHHGRLLIGKNSLQGFTVKGTKATKNLMDADMDYQADMGWGEPRLSKGQSDGLSRLKPDDVAVEQLLKMEPRVECTGDSMKLQVQNAASTPGSLFFVDRGSSLSPLPLTKLPPSCGYTIRSTLRDLVLVAPYDGCFVALEEDSYILPLLWLGLAVKMSCPLMRQSSPNPPMVTCHTEGMVVKTEWTVSVTKVKVNLTGDWEPLMKASPRCGFSVIVHPDGIVISVRYEPCLRPKDGMYTLGLTGDGETKISCPLLSAAQLQPTKSPAKGPQQQTETPSKWSYPSIPSYNPASAHVPEPSLTNPAQMAVSHVPGFPQIPEVSNRKPNEGPRDIYQPQLPYFPFYPKPTATVQEATPPRKNQQFQQAVIPENRLLNPEGQAPQPLIPLPFHPLPGQPKEPDDYSVQPQAIRSPEDQMPHPFNSYYYYPQHVTFPPATTIQQQEVTTPATAQTTSESTIPGPSDVVQQSASYIPPVHCPQFCPSGVSNCCPQIAFHQHLHHIVPAGSPPANPGLPFFPLEAYSVFGNGFGSAPLPQKPTQATVTQPATSSTSATTPPQSHPSENEKQPYLQPPDGNPAALPGSNPSTPTNPEQPIYPYFVPNSLYPDWPYPPQNQLLQSLPQGPSPAHHSVPPKHPPGNEPVNPIMQYEPSNIQPPVHQTGSAGDMNNPIEHNLFALIRQHQHQARSKQNEPQAKELQPSNRKSNYFKGPTHPKVPSEFDHLLVPYYMLQDAEAPTHNKSVFPNNSQPQKFASGSKKSTRLEEAVGAYPEPKSYVLLQHGPPGRELHSFHESPLSFRQVGRDANFLTQILEHQKNKPQHPQNLKSLQEKSQPSKWLGKGMSNPLPGNINYIARTGDKSERLPLMLPAPDGADFVPLPHGRSPSAAHLNPKFLQSPRDMWKPTTSFGPSQRVPPYIPGNVNNGALQQMD